MDWLKTVTELTDPMVARQAIEDAELLDALDFRIACECSSPDFYCRADSHDADVYSKSECGEAHPLCSAAADAIRRFARDPELWYECPACIGWHYFHSVSFLPIRATS